MKKGTLTILLYHGVTDEKQNGIVNFSGKHVNLKIFEDQMKFIKNKYNILSMNDVVEIYNMGKGWPNNSVAVTFDDGFKNNYNFAAEILDKYKIPATFYICAGMIDTNSMFWVDKIEDCINRSKNMKIKIKLEDISYFDLNNFSNKVNAVIQIKKYCKLLSSEKKDNVIKELIEKTQVIPSSDSSPDYKMMTWSDVNNLNKNKLFIIGGHTLNHEIMSFQNTENMKKDISSTLSIINYKLNQKTKHFSYPEGQKHHYNQSVISTLIDNNIICSPSAVDGINTDEDLFNLKRIMPNFMGRKFPF